MENSMISITDNHYEGISIADDHKKNIAAIANKTLKKLVAESPNLLIFPPYLGTHEDDIEKSPICVFDGDKLRTSNFMGFVSHKETQLSITSRFHSTENDFFLHYLLQKVFRINVLNFNIATDKENIWDIFLIYLFPTYLKKALNQGLYKEYQRKQYNDANVKGTINVARHIRQNMPFKGTIAYDVREHSYDNRMTQLIRHTIEYIKIHPFASNVLNGHHETREAMNTINSITATYSRGKRHEIVTQNIKTVNHPFYTEYELLRKICLQILRKEGLSFGKNDKDKTYGVVFDGAWLWEEYLNTFLKEKGFTHAENKTGKNPAYLLQGKDGKQDKWEIYPDFYKKKLIVLDAKYKRLIKDDKKNISRDDKFQIISYMHVLKTEKGGFVFPLEEKNCYDKIGTLNGYGGTLHLFGLKIPQGSTSYEDFKNEMAKSEKELVDNL